MEKTSFKKQLSQLFVAATVGIVVITVLTKDAVTVHRLSPIWSSPRFPSRLTG